MKLAICSEIVYMFSHIDLLLWILLNITNLQTREKEENKKLRVIKHHL